MPTAEDQMSAEQKEKLRVLRLHEEDIEERKKALFKEVGATPPGPDIASSHEQDDRNGTAWDRMTMAERLELWRSNPEKWKELLDAKEQVGLRKLFGS